MTLRTKTGKTGENGQIAKKSGQLKMAAVENNSPENAKMRTAKKRPDGLLKMVPTVKNESPAELWSA